MTLCRSQSGGEAAITCCCIAIRLFEPRLQNSTKETLRNSLNEFTDNVCLLLHPKQLDFDYLIETEVQMEL